MIRTDSTIQSIEKFFFEPSTSSTQVPANSSQILSTSHNNSKIIQPTQLTSINELLNEVQANSDEDLKSQLRKLIYVGNADRKRTLIQCENILYICDNRRLAKELFYQQVLRKFENFDAFDFESDLRISKLAQIGFDLKECEWTEEDGSKDELSKQVESVLMEHRDMLEDYFQISFNKKCELKGLPIIIDNFSPLMAHLPMFIIRLATEVNYDDEKECFRTISEELAYFYSRWSLKSEDKDFNFLMEHVIFPEIRKNLIPSKEMANDGTFLKLTSLQELYRVFERC